MENCVADFYVPVFANGQDFLALESNVILATLHIRSYLCL